MKKILFLTSMSISMLAVVTMSSCSEHKSVTSDSEGEATSITKSSLTDIVPIADSQFKTYLVGNTNINTNGNSEIEVGEAMAFNGEIDVNNNVSINSLEGLKYFKNLKRLNCSNTSIVNLDISENTALESLDCSSCKELVGSVPGTRMATQLDLTKNIRLTAVNCSQTDNLKGISVSADYIKLIKSFIKDKTDTVRLVRVVIKG